MTDVPRFLSDGAETYEKKNDDYGDSWRKVGYIMWELADGDEIVLESAEDCISFGLMTRRLDKFARAFNGEFRDGDTNFESIKDAHLDDMVYAAMSASNFDDKRDESDDEEDGGPAIGIEHVTAKVTQD